MKFTGGFSFGLNVPQTDAPKKRRSNVFGGGAEEEVHVEKTPAEVMKERLAALSAKSEAQIEAHAAQHASLDPTANEYDGVWDVMKEKDERVQQEKRLKQSIRGKPKYVHKLIATADKRQQQHDLWYQRKLQRELEADEAEYGETEKFVTPAYAKHLEELKKVKAEEERKEEEEKKRSGASRGMTGFYSSLLQGQFSGATLQDDSEVRSEHAEEKEEEEEVSGAGKEESGEDAVEAKLGTRQRRVLVEDGSSLENALGVKIQTEEDRKRKLRELNVSKLDTDAIAAARARALARRRAAAE